MIKFIIKKFLLIYFIFAETFIEQLERIKVHLLKKDKNREFFKNKIYILLDLKQKIIVFVFKLLSKKT